MSDLIDLNNKKFSKRNTKTELLAEVRRLKKELEIENEYFKAINDTMYQRALRRLEGDTNEREK